LEIRGIICDDLPAQVAGLHTFFESRAEDVPRIMHILCLNHMLSLVFTHTIRTYPFANVATYLPQVIHALNSPPGIEVVIDVRLSSELAGCIMLTSLVLSSITMTIPKALARIGDLMIPKGFAQVHLVLFPLSLFSRAVEERQRLLANGLPIPIEVLCGRKRFIVFLYSQLMASCLHLLCSHFTARLRRTSVAIVATAFPFTPLGRASICGAE
jgi:hypothetical protein